MQVYAAEVRRLKNLFLIFEGGFKQIGDDFEIVFVFAVGGVETAAGNCHVFVDADADIDMAVKIVLNAKVQRPSVCNAAETLLIDKKIADKFIPVMFKALKEKNVEIRADQNSKAIFADVNDVTDEDYYTEYNDYIMAVKVVDGID